MGGVIRLGRGQTLPKGLRKLAREAGYNVLEPRKEDPLTLASNRRDTLSTWGAYCPDWCVWVYSPSTYPQSCDLCGKSLVRGVDAQGAPRIDQD